MKLPCLYSMCTASHQQHGRTGSTIDSAAQQQHTHIPNSIWYTHKEYYGDQQSSQQQHAQRIVALFSFGHNIHQRSFRWTSMEGNEVRYQIHLTICSQRLCIICHAPKKTPAQPQQPESGRRKKKKNWANRLDFLVVYINDLSVLVTRRRALLYSKGVYSYTSFQLIHYLSSISLSLYNKWCS